MTDKEEQEMLAKVDDLLEWAHKKLLRSESRSTAEAHVHIAQGGEMSALARVMIERVKFNSDQRTMPGMMNAGMEMMRLAMGGAPPERSVNVRASDSSPIEPADKCILCEREIGDHPAYRTAAGVEHVECPLELGKGDQR